MRRSEFTPPTLEDLLLGTAEGIKEHRGIMRCDIVTPEHGIPILVWSWELTNFVSISEEKLSKLSKEDQSVVKTHLRESRYDGDGFCGTIRWKDAELVSVSLMNFRRYGWATAPGYAPEHGWAGPDTIWANHCVGAVPCCTTEEVMHGSLVSCIERAGAHYNIPKNLLHNHQVRPLYRELLDEALHSERARSWACQAIADDNGALGDVMISRKSERKAS